MTLNYMSLTCFLNHFKSKFRHFWFISDGHLHFHLLSETYRILSHTHTHTHTDLLSLSLSLCSRLINVSWLCSWTFSGSKVLITVCVCVCVCALLQFRASHWIDLLIYLRQYEQICPIRQREQTFFCLCWIHIP